MKKKSHLTFPKSITDTGNDKDSRMFKLAWSPSSSSKQPFSFKHPRGLEQVIRNLLSKKPKVTLESEHKVTASTQNHSNSASNYAKYLQIRRLSPFEHTKKKKN